MRQSPVEEDALTEHESRGRQERRKGGVRLRPLLLVAAIMLAKDLWASLDLTWVTGGRASLDGIEGEALNNLGAGFTLGYHINDSLQLTAGYMATVNDKEPTDLRMDGFRVSLLFGWHPLVEGMKRLKAE